MIELSVPENGSTTVGLRSRTISEMFGIPASTLHSWVQVGLVAPSIRGPQGRRVEQYWSVQDAVVVRVVKELRRSGASLQQVKKAAAAITRYGESLSSARLYWDGRDVLLQSDDGDLVSTIVRPGQLTWFLAVLPLGKWHQQAVRKAEPIDIEAMRELDRRRTGIKRSRQRATRVESLVGRSRRAAGLAPDVNSVAPASLEARRSS